jgi:hypothetical protein
MGRRYSFVKILKIFLWKIDILKKAKLDMIELNKIYDMNVKNVLVNVANIL